MSDLEAAERLGYEEAVNSDGTISDFGRTHPTNHEAYMTVDGQSV